MGRLVRQLRHPGRSLGGGVLAALSLTVGLSTVARAHEGREGDPYDPTNPIPWCSGCEHEGHGEALREHSLAEVIVDCSQTHGGRRGVPSVRLALKLVRPNGTIRILPPGEGETCRESLEIRFPVKIVGAEGGQAVIQAPQGQPCITATVPLGDSLELDRVKLIARGGTDMACIHVRAGRVVVRNTEIDSRYTDWAFDVDESGELVVDDTKVETDGSGVHAVRARVDLRGLDVDMPPSRKDIALFLDRTDGQIDGGEIVGGRWGVLASSGAHGLSIEGTKIRDANTAVQLVAGAQGTIRVENLALWRDRNSIVVGPYVDALVRDNHIERSQDVGIVAFASDARIEANEIFGGQIGIRVVAADTSKLWTDTPLVDSRPVDDPPVAGTPEIVGNHIGDVTHTDIYVEQIGSARIVGNQLRAVPGCHCIEGPGIVLVGGGNDCQPSPFSH